MDSQKLNSLLLEEFPQIRHQFDDFVSWQEGMATGSHVVFEDVFVPYILDRIAKNDAEEVKRCFDFVESLFSLHDDYADDVAGQSVLEALSEGNAHLDLSSIKLGKLSEQYYEKYLKNFQN
jgi:hypothetical protein